MKQTWIDPERLTARFCRLVEIDSPSFGERAMCDALREPLAQLGIPSREDGAAAETGGNCGNLLAFAEGTLPLPPLLFCAHMDTVEPSRGKRAVRRPDGTITSAGDTVLGADDAAALAAILEALTVLRETGLPHRPLELLFTAAEEPYCAGARRFDCGALRSREAYVFDLSGPVGTAALAAPTILPFRLTFRGRAAHAAFAPEDGISALKAAAAAAAAIPCGRVGGAVVNLGTIRGGTADNIVPDCCVLTGEIRSLDHAEALARREALFAAAASAAGQFGAVLETAGEAPCTACRTAPDSAAARRFTEACASLGLTARFCDTFGGSDNNVLARSGITGLVAATAMNRCHSCGEYTTVSELTRAAELVLALMRSET